jgi:hypothetical protein
MRHSPVPTFQMQMLLSEPRKYIYKLNMRTGYTESELRMRIRYYEIRIRTDPDPYIIKQK